jgi:hypothetical protein
MPSSFVTTSPLPRKAAPIVCRHFHNRKFGAERLSQIG